MLTDIQQRVRTQVALAHEGTQIVGPLYDAESRLHEDLGFDSLDKVELILNIEEEFQIILKDEDVELMRTIGDIESTVARLL